MEIMARGSDGMVYPIGGGAKIRYMEDIPQEESGNLCWAKTHIAAATSTMLPYISYFSTFKDGQDAQQESYYDGGILLISASKTRQYSMLFTAPSYTSYKIKQPIQNENKMLACYDENQLGLFVKEDFFNDSGLLPVRVIDPDDLRKTYTVAKGTLSFNSDTMHILYNKSAFDNGLSTCTYSTWISYRLTAKTLTYIQSNSPYSYNNLAYSDIFAWGSSFKYNDHLVNYFVSSQRTYHYWISHSPGNRNACRMSVCICRPRIQLIEYM